MREKQYIPTNKPGTFIKTQLYYTKGGMSMYDYKSYASGYYGSASVVKLEKGEGYTTESFVLFGNGYKIHLLEAARAGGKKKPAEAAAIWAEKSAELVARVASEAGLSLGEKSEESIEA